MVKGQKCLHFSKVCCWHETCTKSQTTEVSFVTLKAETSLTGLFVQPVFQVLPMGKWQFRKWHLHCQNQQNNKGQKKKFPITINEVH